MLKNDYRAIYVFCDGSMMYDSQSSGGIGYVIKFPEYLELEDYSDYDGTFVDANIERVELAGLIAGMEGLRDYLKINEPDLSQTTKIVMITDRFALQDSDRTSAFKIRDWRSNQGKNFEGKEIKNWDLLNKLDKTRTKLCNESSKSLRIEFRKRKFNKEADKLSKTGRKEGLVTRSISIEGHKIGKRKYDGPEIKYNWFSPKEELIINIFRKRPIKEQWEINAEICSDKRLGHKIKIIVDHELQDKLKRGNTFKVKIKTCYNYHFEIYRTIKKVKLD